MRIRVKSNKEILNQLFKIAKNYNLNTDTYYTKSYLYYIEYFEKLETLDEEHIIIGVGLTYSWMPTIPKRIDINIIQETIPLLNQVKSGGEILNIEQLKLLKKFCNNSLVGASKLLHFINPYDYAIWDSRVFKYLNEGEPPHRYKLENYPDKYLDYLKFLNELKLEDEFMELYEIINKKIGYANYTISKNRALELIFFNANYIS